MVVYTLTCMFLKSVISHWMDSHYNTTVPNYLKFKLKQEFVLEVF